MFTLNHRFHLVTHTMNCKRKC